MTEALRDVAAVTRGQGHGTDAVVRALRDATESARRAARTARQAHGLAEPLPRLAAELREMLEPFRVPAEAAEPGESLIFAPAPAAEVGATEAAMGNGSVIKEPTDNETALHHSDS
jgi:hypothetical protein